VGGGEKRIRRGSSSSGSDYSRDRCARKGSNSDGKRLQFAEREKHGGRKKQQVRTASGSIVPINGFQSRDRMESRVEGNKKYFKEGGKK